MIGNMIIPVNSVIMGPLSYFFGCEIPWSETILCGILQQWMRHSVCPADDSFGRCITCRKGKSITRISIVLSAEEWVQCSQPATSHMSGHPGNWYHIRISELVSAVGLSRTQQQQKPGQVGEWNVVKSISDTIVTLFMGPLVNDRDG